MLLVLSKRIICATLYECIYFESSITQEIQWVLHLLNRYTVSWYGIKLCMHTNNYHTLVVDMFFNALSIPWPETNSGERNHHVIRDINILCAIIVSQV